MEELFHIPFGKKQSFFQYQRYIHLYFLLQLELGIEVTALVLKFIANRVYKHPYELLAFFIEENSVFHHTRDDYTYLLSNAMYYQRYKYLSDDDEFPYLGTCIYFTDWFPKALYIVLVDCGQSVNVIQYKYKSQKCYESIDEWQIIRHEGEKKFEIRAIWSKEEVIEKITEMDFYWKLSDMLRFFKSRIKQMTAYFLFFLQNYKTVFNFCKYEGVFLLSG